MTDGEAPRRRLVPSPRHGWRVFAGEVGIIVLGVLLALGAQQVAEVIAMRGRVAEFRKAVGGEMAGNLWYMQVRRDRVACETRRLDELKQWLQEPRGGEDVRIARSPLLKAWSIDTGVWQNRDPEVFAALPVEHRLLYGQFYDTVIHLEGITVQLRKDEAALRGLEVAGTLGDSDRRRFYEIAAGSRELMTTQISNIDSLFDVARRLGVAKHPPVFIDAARDATVQRRVTECPDVLEGKRA